MQFNELTAFSSIKFHICLSDQLYKNFAMLVGVFRL